MKVVLLLLFLPFLNADYASQHIYKYLNHSVSPCDDFKGHVCSGTHWEYSGPESYEDTVRKVKENQWHDPILNDLIDLQDADSRKPCNNWRYYSALRERCGNRTQCYSEEFHYFLKLYNWMEKYSDLTIGRRMEHLSRTVDHSADEIEKLQSVTYGMIERMLRQFDFPDVLQRVKQYYLHLKRQIRVMSDIVYDKPLMEYGQTPNLKALVEDLRTEIGKLAEGAPWAHEIDLFSRKIGRQLLEKFNTTKVIFPFDDLRESIKYWKVLLRTFSADYFSNIERKTTCPRFDVIHSFVSANLEMINRPKSTEESVMFYRLFNQSGLYYNESLAHGFFTVQANSFYPSLSDNSTDTTKYAYGAYLAENMLKVFSGNTFTNLCNKQLQRINPEVDGLRMAHLLLKKKLGAENLKEMEYPDLGITKEQAFFYAYAKRFCGKSETDLNKILRQSPEFAQAFGCANPDHDPGMACTPFGRREKPIYGFVCKTWKSKRAGEMDRVQCVTGEI